MNLTDELSGPLVRKVEYYAEVLRQEGVEFPKVYEFGLQVERSPPWRRQPGALLGIRINDAKTEYAMKLPLDSERRTIDRFITDLEIAAMEAVTTYATHMAKKALESKDKGKNKKFAETMVALDRFARSRADRDEERDEQLDKLASAVVRSTRFEPKASGESNGKRSKGRR